MLRRGSTWKIFRIAWPIAMAALSSQLLIHVDFAMIGHLSTDALAAVSVATTVIHLLIIVANSLSFGLATLLSMELGVSNREEAGRTIAAGVYNGFFLGLVLCGTTHLFAPGLLVIMGLQGDVLQMAQDYASVFAYGLIAGTVNFMISACLAAHTRTRQVLVASIIVTVVNIVGDYALIFGHWGMPEMGVRGAALASVIATASGTAYLLVALLSLWRPLSLSVFIPPSVVFKKGYRILRLGVSTTAEWGLWFVGIALINAFLAPFGSAALAVYNVALKISGLFMLGTWGVKTANNVMVSRSFASGNLSRIRFWHIRTYQVAFLTLLPGSLVMLLIPDQLFSIFISTQDLEKVGNIHLIGLMLVALFITRTYNTISGTTLRSMGILKFFIYNLIISQILQVSVAFVGICMLNYGLIAAFFANMIDEGSRNFMNTWKWRLLSRKKPRSSPHREIAPSPQLVEGEL